MSYQSHPEMMGPDGTPGLESMQMASAQQMQFGDLADVEAGGTVYVVRTSGYASGSRPFLKVTAHPTENWTVGIGWRRRRIFSRLRGSIRCRQELPVAAIYQGRLQTEGGLHQEFTVGRKTGRGLVQIAYYRDSLSRVAVVGWRCAECGRYCGRRDKTAEAGFLPIRRPGTFGFWGMDTRLKD